MNDLRYQVELLSALNDKLSAKEKMCDFILQTSANAFIYQDFIEGQFQIAGGWDNFFQFKFRTSSDYQQILEYADEKFVEELKDNLYLEKTGETKRTIVFKIKGKRKWYECEANVE